jgi:hypothetical protein
MGGVHFSWPIIAKIDRKRKIAIVEEIPNK